MVRSTAGLLNFRLASGVRTTGKSLSAAQLTEPSIMPEVRSEVLRMNCLRFIASIISRRNSG